MSEHEPTGKGPDECDEFQMQRFDWEGGLQGFGYDLEEQRANLARAQMDRLCDIRLATDDGNDRPIYAPDI